MGKGLGAVDLALALCCVRGQLNGSQLASQTIRKAPLSSSYPYPPLPAVCCSKQTGIYINKSTSLRNEEPDDGRRQHLKLNQQQRLQGG